MAALTDEILATFTGLLKEAKSSGELEATAMNLATCDGDGKLSSRMVLMKAAGVRGFVFYTNLNSRKAEQLRENQNVALCFHWKHLRHGVQVRIEGEIELVSDVEADAYFASRPRGSQIGAWASDQSRLLPSREEFERRIEQVEARFAGREVDRPPNWSGYRVKPLRIEFWYGAEFRLHDRHVHEWIDGAWQHRLLFP